MRLPFPRAVEAISVVGFALVALAADSPTPRDAHSQANPHQVRVKHVHVDLTTDFDVRALRGKATLRFERQPGCPPLAPLVLDTRDLTIERVTAGVRGQEPREVEFKLGRPDRILGSPLSIAIPAGATEAQIRYHTAPGASALQWLDPLQTAGGKRAFLFTQSQAIHARSWIPLQDSPGVRVTYSASIEVPEGLKAVMSAEAKGVDHGRYRFEMPQAIPSYLIALAVGDLDFRPLGNRCGVWAEPSVLDRAVYEFADTEKMVAAAERRYGPYRWGRYDVLVLPPSFPFGGMENARLTFATPTVLAGDRSLVALVAHELAHSWSGNLVTGATWRDFWLNEGFTTYIERRIVEDLYGPERAAMEWVLGRRELMDELARLKSRPGDQILHIDLAGRDPDDGMTRIAYEKGALFLALLERTLGRDGFDRWLRGYFDRHAFQSITTADFEADVREHLFPKTRPGEAEPIDLRAWVHNPGLPPDAPRFSADRFDAVDRQARDWLDGKSAASALKTADWSTHEWLRFLDDLPPRLSVTRMAELDAVLKLTARSNTEIAQAWLLKAIRSDYQPAVDRLEPFLTTIGRRKYVVPLYTELFRTQGGKARARAIYAKARPLYHPITVEAVDRILKAP